MEVTYKPWLRPILTRAGLKNIFFDPSSWSLIAANVLTIVIALREQWSLANLMWIYWAQSLIIGFFQFFKILDLKEFTTENFKINNRLVGATQAIKVYVAFFFAFHYGFFHLIYFLFLAQGFFFQRLSQNAVSYLVIIGAFFLNHLFSYFNNRKIDQKQVKNIGQMMFYPYARIIPMHVTIIFGKLLLGQLPLLLFLALKTLADAVMHSSEHTSQS